MKTTLAASAIALAAVLTSSAAASPAGDRTSVLSYYACRRNEVWDDAGDTVELLGVGGGLLATKTC